MTTTATTGMVHEFLFEVRFFRGYGLVFVRMARMVGLCIFSVGFHTWPNERSLAKSQKIILTYGQAGSTFCLPISANFWAGWLINCLGGRIRTRGVYHMARQIEASPGLLLASVPDLLSRVV